MSSVITHYIERFATSDKDEISIGIILTISAGVITAVIYYFAFSVKDKEKSKVTTREIKSFDVPHKKPEPEVQENKDKPAVAQPKTDPCLAKYEATTASCLLASQQYIESLPKPVTPFLANYEVTTASCLLVSQQYIESLPKPVTPFLANFEATTAFTLLAAEKHIASLPKKVDPFLADYEATTARVLLQSSKYIEQIKPSVKESALAKYDASTACHLLKASEYVASMPKPPSPFLAKYEATTAATLHTAQKYIESLPKPAKPFLAQYEATTALTLLHARNYVELLPKPVQPFLANYESTTAGTLLAARNYISSLEPSNQSSKSASRAISRQNSSFSVTASPFHPTNNTTIPFQQSPASSPQGLLVSDHDSAADSEPETEKDYNQGRESVFVMANTFAAYDERTWARLEKIQKQSQNHLPKMKSRCNYWPNCTNKHCKYWHPVKDCRMGDQCAFRERCMFLHPEDYGIVARGKRKNQNKKNNTNSYNNNNRKETTTSNANEAYY
ncbi:hypothetical protein CU097_008444 [Rhizopus azygosporus]|uniref:C3H1-type domain-containing protein n=2 Tax=Rhizopus TaxID=4842 RepID=A0A367JHY2_RHIAZ|nr:hypothetical protein BCV71DRAFT_267816 [Rhizopus microsporus]RCH89550.1 hypothetical protein CU097_008444 [Rhizopus azygosporus]CEI95496.1 hypothetical protein RMCBS344292_09680 [Rhizopus microsporus]